MIALALKYALPLKAIAIVAAAGFAYWWVWSSGVASERARWEAATVVETARQSDVNRAAFARSETAASALLGQEVRNARLLRRLADEAALEDNAGGACLGPSSVLRLNALSD